MTRYFGTIAASPKDVSFALAAQLVRDIQAVLAVRVSARVVFSTGATPVRTYEVLRQKYRTALPWQRVCVQQLDEYSGLAKNDARRFSIFLRAHLVGPLGTHFCELTGEESASDLVRYETDIAAAGGLDLVLYGVGVNGHLGFNEPGSAFASATRRVVLHESTRERITTEDGPAPHEAVTLGLGALNAAARVRVVALGAAKRDALTRGLLEPPHIDMPLSSLQAHPDVQFYMDAAAAPHGLALAPPRL